MTHRHPRREELLRFVDQQLGLDRRLTVEQHLADCPTCRAQVTLDQRVEDAVQALARPDFTAADRSRMRAGIRARRQEPVQPTRPRRWRQLIPLAVAAGFVLAAGVASIDPGPDADPARLSTTAPPATPPPPSHHIIAPAAARRPAHVVSLDLDAPRADAWDWLEQLDDERTLVDGLNRLAQLPLNRRTGPAAESKLRPRLVRWFSSDHGLAVMATLLSYRSPSACATVVTAWEADATRRDAARALLTSSDPSLLRTQFEVVRTLVESAQPVDRELLRDAMSAWPGSAQTRLKWADRFAAESVPASRWQALLEPREAIYPAWRSSLQGRGPLPVAAATRLAQHAPDEQLIDALLERARGDRRSRDAVAAIAACRSVESLLALSQLANEDVAADRSSQLVQAHFADAWRPLSPAFASRVLLTLPAESTDGADFLHLLARALPRKQAIAALFDVASFSLIHWSARRVAIERLAAFGLDAIPPLRDLVAVECERLPWERDPVRTERVAALVVALYRAEGVTALRAGCDQLGVELDDRRERDLARTLHRRGRNTNLGDVMEILALTP